LLGTNEEYQIGVCTTCIANELVFFQRQRERLLTEYMLARLERFDRNFNVPMVWRGNTHHIY
jgi:hypothetical protein